VVGRALGLKCGKVYLTTERDGDRSFTLGIAKVDNPQFTWKRGDGSKRRAAGAFCVTLYAGAEAVRIRLLAQGDGDASDREKAAACLRWAGVKEDDLPRREMLLRRRAIREVRLYREEIEMVAAGLIRYQEMPGPVVDQVFAVVAANRE